jgi:serine protease Do
MRILMRILMTRVLFCFAVAMPLVLSERLLAYDLPRDNGKSEISSASTDNLKKLSTGLAEIAKHTRKSLVFISVSKNITLSGQGQIDPFEFFFGPGNGRPGLRQEKKQKQEGLGSGFFIDISKGYLLTNNHVVEDADEITIKLANGKTYPGKVLGRDKNTDIAVVRISEDKFDRSGLEQLTVSEVESLDVGELVVAMGAPFGLEASLSFGVVSATGRGNLQITQLGNFIQTDAAINPGNSGGPLVGMDGKVVGINTAIFSKSGAYNGIGFAVPAKLVRSIAEKLINQGVVKRGYIGIGMQPLTDELKEGLNLGKNETGTLVRQVEPSSPASKAGIKEGDVLLQVDNKTITNESDLSNAIGLSNPGDKVQIVLWRNGEKKTVGVTVGEFPSDEVLAGGKEKDPIKPAKGAPFGIAVQNLTADLRSELESQSKSGAVVSGVEPDSPAAKAGLMRGDIIIACNGQKITNASEFQSLASSSKRLLLRIERDGSFAFVSLKR